MLKQRLEGMIRFCAQVNDWIILELNIQDNHVHLLLQAQADDSPADIMQRIKGGTSRKLRQMFPNSVESIWAKHFWADGYFAATVGARDPAEIQKYIRNQDLHHAKELGKDPTDF